MRLSYAELEAFLAELHHIAPARRVALKGRLKHFQRLSWPAGTNKGKGARVEYGIGQTMSLAVGFEMLQLGLTPERVVQQLKMGGRTLAGAFDEALSDYGPYADPIFYIFSPESLHTLRDEPDEQTGLRCMIVSRDLLPKALMDESPLLAFRRFALINLTDLLDRYVEYFVDKGLGAPENLREPIANWKQVETEAIEKWQAHVLEGLDYGSDKEA